MDPRDPSPDGLQCGPITRQAPQAVTFRPADVRFFICDRCGGREYWQPYQGGRAFCVRCRPQPEAIRPAVIGADRMQPSQGAAPAAVPTAKTETSRQQPQPTATTQPSRQPQPARDWPIVIKHFALSTVEATRTRGAGGGYRLLLLGKALDVKGEGRIKREDLRAYCNHLNIDPRTYRHCIDEARGLGLLQDVQAAPEKGGEWFFILASYAQAAAAIYLQSVENDQERISQGKPAKGANVTTLGNRKASINAADLFGDGWRARVWACYEKLHLEKPISLERKEQLTHIAPSTQTQRNKQAGVQKVRNYARTAITSKGMTNSGDQGDRLRGMRENSGRKGLHVRHDGAFQFCVPSHAIVTDEFITVGARGSARKYNKRLRALLRLEALPLVRRGLTSESEPDQDQGAADWRIFNYTDKQFKATRKKIRDLKPSGGDLYACPKRSRRGNVIWEHASAADYLPGAGRQA